MQRAIINCLLAKRERTGMEWRLVNKERITWGMVSPVYPRVMIKGLKVGIGIRYL